MISLLHALVRAEQSPAFDPDRVSPGVAGFIVTGLLAGAVILLLLSFNRRMRRIRVRDEIRVQLAAELADRDGAGPDGAAGPNGSADSGAPGAPDAPAPPRSPA